MYDRSDGIEEGKVVLARERLHGGAQGRRRERPRGDDDAVPLGGREAGDLAALDRDERMGAQPLGHLHRKPIAIDGERAAGRQLVAVGSGEDQRARAPHLLMQEPDGARLPVVGAERVRAHELGERIRLVGVRHLVGPHLMDHDGDVGGGDLPGGFRARKAAADDVDGLLLCHGGGR